jgi:hypothetical protein
MTVLTGPKSCQEYLPYDGSVFPVCHGRFPCRRNHASTREIARKFDEWASSRAYANVWLSFEEGHDPKDIKAWIGAVLGLNMTREENDGHVAKLMEGTE